MTRVLLVDGKNALYRAAAGSGWLDAGYDGDMGAHVYLFARAVMRAVERCAPCTCVVVWEGERNWRRTAYPAYKAHRAPRELDFSRPADVEVEAIRVRFAEDQVHLRSMLSAIGALQAHPEDGEADDAIATLARRFASSGKLVTIWSGDHDLLQCVREGSVEVITPGRASVLATHHDRVYATDADVEAKMGVPARKVPDLKAIEGDASDNIPGVPGLGRVAATNLLAHNGSLEGVILSAQMSLNHERVVWNGTEKQRGLILKHAEDARLYRRLAELCENAAVRFDRPAPDVERARSLMRQMQATGLTRQGTFAEFRRLVGSAR